MKSETKRLLIGTIITFASVTLTAAIIYVLKSLFDMANGSQFTTNTFLNIIDGLSIAGILGVLIFVLTWLSGAGAFDIIAYSLKLAFYNTFRRNVRQTALPNSYAEYKELKHGKKSDSYLFLLLGSLPCLTVGIVLAIIYSVR